MLSGIDHDLDAAACGTSASSTFTVPCQLLKRRWCERSWNCRSRSRSCRACRRSESCSAAWASRACQRRTASRRADRSSPARSPTLLVGLEEAPARAALVLIDRALVVGGRQRHAHGRGHHARLDGGLAQHHAAVELLEVRHAHQRPGVGRGVFVQQQAALAVGAIERRAVHQPHVMDGHRPRRPHQRHGLVEIERRSRPGSWRRRSGPSA